MKAMWGPLDDCFELRRSVSCASWRTVSLIRVRMWYTIITGETMPRETASSEIFAPQANTKIIPRPNEQEVRMWNVVKCEVKCSCNYHACGFKISQRKRRKRARRERERERERERYEKINTWWYDTSTICQCNIMYYIDLYMYVYIYIYIYICIYIYIYIYICNIYVLYI